MVAKGAFRTGVLATAALLALVGAAPAFGASTPGGGAVHASGFGTASCAVTPQPATGAATPLDGVCSYLAQRDPGVSTQITIFDNTSGKGYSVSDGDMPQLTASIAKVDILAKWLNDFQEDGVKIPGGIDYSVQYLMQNMIENSNNQAATALFYFGGGCKELTAFNRLIPMNSTKVGCETSDYYGWGNTTTTSSDQVALMKAFAYGSNQYVSAADRRAANRRCDRKKRRASRESCKAKAKRSFDRIARTPVLNKAARTYGLDLMEDLESDQSWGLTCGPWGTSCSPPNYAPPDPAVTVAHKNGWKTLPAPTCSLPVAQCPWQVNSTGWVKGKGRDYVMTVLTTNNPVGPDINDGFNYGIATIQGVSQLVWANTAPAAG